MIHGISDKMVRTKPTLQQVLPRIHEIIAGEQVVIYNAKFDKSFFPGRLRQAKTISCAMRRFAIGGPWREWKWLHGTSGTSGRANPPCARGRSRVSLHLAMAGATKKAQSIGTTSIADRQPPWSAEA